MWRFYLYGSECVLFALMLITFVRYENASHQMLFTAAFFLLMGIRGALGEHRHEQGRDRGEDRHG